jgi:hypothetical protein
MGIDKKLEIMTEMVVLAMAMFLAAFFCFRVMLLPKATETTIDKTHDSEHKLGADGLEAQLIYKKMRNQKYGFLIGK